MKIIEGRKYRCIQPKDHYDCGISGEQAIENCYDNIITVEHLGYNLSVIKVRENGWWVDKRWLRPLCRILKYNKEKLCKNW